MNSFLDAEGKPGTLTAAAHRPALFTMVGIMAVGFVANLLIRPVAAKFREATSGATTSKPLSANHTGRTDSAAPTSSNAGGSAGANGARSVRVSFSWELVSVMLAYGVIQTVITAAKLFS